MAIATQAATAATQAALQTLRPAAAPDPTENLSARDKREYEVATHLAKTDPRFKDAPRVVLDQIRMADEYASRWEAANPGKVFDPEDEDHNDFYARLQRPWTPEEFQDAAIDMRAEQKMKAVLEQQGEKMSEVTESTGRVELAPVVEQHFSTAAMSLAEMVSPELKAAIGTKGWDGLRDADPVTAQVIGATLQQLHPFIEAAVQLDDPHRRFKLDTKKNAAHAQWNQVVQVGEANLAGQVDGAGRMFARRADYVKMTQAQQAQHWFLTQDMIIQGAVEYAAEQVKIVSEQQKKMLEGMGFVRQTGAPAAPAATPPGTPATPPAATPADTKPVSPSVGSGAKIDQPAGGAATGEGALLQKISDVLFRK